MQTALETMVTETQEEAKIFGKKTMSAAGNIFPQVSPEIEDAAFQALALENAESWL